MTAILDRMCRHPAADWTAANVATVCAQHGVRFTAPTGGGSHYKVSHPSQREILTIPTQDRSNRCISVSPFALSKLAEEIMAHLDYPVVIEPLTVEDGGGYLAIVPDLPGCMSDGVTREQAARSVGDAIEAWIEEALALGREIPAPSWHLAAVPG